MPLDDLDELKSELRDQSIKRQKSALSKVGQPGRLHLTLRLGRTMQARGTAQSSAARSPCSACPQVLALELQGVHQVGPSWLQDVLSTHHGQDPELKKQVYSFIQVGRAHLLPLLRPMRGSRLGIWVAITPATPPLLGPTGQLG